MKRLRLAGNRRLFWLLITKGALVLFLMGCNTGESVGASPEIIEEWKIEDASSRAFSHPMLKLGASELALHDKGDLGFEATFVAAGPVNRDGLGPLFNEVSCAACHVSDGRGTPPTTGSVPLSLLLRTSLPGEFGAAPVAVPGFGAQLQPRAIAGETPEVNITVEWLDSVVELAGGEIIALRLPRWSVVGNLQPFPPEAMLSARLAPPVFGLGLLELIPDEDLAALEDPFDADGDSISGHRNRIRLPDGTLATGRFGWKANTIDLRAQAAAAYRNDMGITTWLEPSENCEGIRASCSPHGAEVDSATLDAVTFYTRTLAVPAPRPLTDQATRGKQLFGSMGCAICHVPEHRTGHSPVEALANQRIQPYTDLLVHDMGSGLADGRPDHGADGNEWRTSPLWGIGLVPVVHGEQAYLHDGRARSLQEAILWHGGEAQKSREAWRLAEKGEREAVLDFLKSL